MFGFTRYKYKYMLVLLTLEMLTTRGDLVYMESIKPLHSFFPPPVTTTRPRLSTRASIALTLSFVASCPSFVFGAQESRAKTLSGI